MILNQWQVFLVVSDWEPYLGRLFCIVVGALLSMGCCMFALSIDSGHVRLVLLFVCLVYFVFFRLSLKGCIHITLRFGHLTTTIVTDPLGM